MPKLMPFLLPGDILLYDSPGLVSWAIEFRTWSDVDHVEIYMDNNQSAASRPSLGVDIYPFRMDGLKYVRRPEGVFDYFAAMDYAESMKGTPYGYADLARFYLVHWPTKGVICSQYGDLLLRAGKINAFAEDYPPGEVSPRDYRITPLARTIYSCASE